MASAGASEAVPVPVTPDAQAKLPFGEGSRGAAEADSAEGSYLADDSDASSQTSGEDTVRAPANSPVRLSSKAAAQSAAEQQFWHILANVITEDAHRVWLSTEKEMQRFRALLQARGGAMARVKQARAQQERLQALLAQQMAAPVNSELQLPPTTLLAAAAHVAAVRSSCGSTVASC